jgi:hypothetical protein
MIITVFKGIYRDGMSVRMNHRWPLVDPVIPFQAYFTPMFFYRSVASL